MRRELLKQVDDVAQIPALVRWASEMIKRGLPGGPVLVTIGRPRRSLDQNSKLWPMLQDVSRSVVWHGTKLAKDEWKDVFTAALRRQKVVPGIDGGLVMIGGRTSKMSKREFSELVEFIYSFGAEHGVEWSEQAKQNFEELMR